MRHRDIEEQDNVSDVRAECPLCEAHDLLGAQPHVCSRRPHRHRRR